MFSLLCLEDTSEEVGLFLLKLFRSLFFFSRLRSVARSTRRNDSLCFSIIGLVRAGRLDRFTSTSMFKLILVDEFSLTGII